MWRLIEKLKMQKSKLEQSGLVKLSKSIQLIDTGQGMSRHKAAEWDVRQVMDRTELIL